MVRSLIWSFSIPPLPLPPPHKLAHESLLHLYEEIVLIFLYWSGSFSFLMEFDQGKLFIGGISWETTEEKLRNYFSSFGEVIEAVIMKDRATGRARGFGFIVFADPSVAEMVIFKKHSIDGRLVEAKKAVPRDEQQNVIRNSNGGLGSPTPSNVGRTKKIFVGGLASTVTENDFKKYFGQFGTITDAVVMYDHGTQRPRGFGFITYETEDSVDRVLQKSFHELNHKMVEVKRAIPKDMSAGPSRNKGAGLGGSPYAGLYAQAFNSSPLLPYVSPMESTYSRSPSSRGLYPPYGVIGHGRNYSGLMNENYGLGDYRGGAFYGGAGYGPSMYGASTSFGGYGGMSYSGSSGSVYGSSPGRSSSGNGGNFSNLFNSADIDNDWLPSLSSSAAMGKWAPSQTLSYQYEGVQSQLTNSSSFGHGEKTSVHKSSLAHFGLSRPHSANSRLVGDIYGSSGYNDSTWRTILADNFSAGSTGFGGLGNGAYGLNRDIHSKQEDVQAVDEGYGAAGRQSY